MDIGGGSATASPCSSYQPSTCASYNPSPGSSNFMSPSSSSFANLTFGDGHQSLMPWLKHLSTTTSSSSASSSSRLPNYLYIPGGSISAPVTPPFSSPTASTLTMNPFFVSSTPPSPTRQTIPESEWFSGIELAQSVPASPTFSLVSQTPFGFKEAAGRGGSRMWTPGQSGTCSPAIITPGADQTSDVPMSEAATPPEFVFGSNTNGLVKAWEGERIHVESGSDDLELTLGNSSTR